MQKSTTTQAKEDIRVAAENALKLVNQAAGENARLLASAISDASKLLASQAESARQVVATQASEALKVTNQNTSSDHDFLLTFSSEVKSELKAIRADIKEIKDNTAQRIDNLEKDKLDVKDSYSLIYKIAMDKKIETLETSTLALVSSRNTVLVMVTGCAAILTTLTVLLITHMFK